jgi:hypothetical protein
MKKMVYLIRFCSASLLKACAHTTTKQIQQFLRKNREKEINRFIFLSVAGTKYGRAGGHIQASATGIALPQQAAHRRLNNRVWILVMIGMVWSFGGWGQNAIVGTGFSGGWGGGGCPTGSTNFTFLDPSAGTSHIVTRNATGTGNQPFRFGIDFGGTTAQRTLTNGSDVAINLNQTYTLDPNCTTNGAMLINVVSPAYNYVFKTLNIGANPAGIFVVFEVQNVIRTITNVSQNPVAASVFINQPVVVTANMDGVQSTGQNVYLRYSTDNFLTSTVLPMNYSGNAATATIPGSTQTGGNTVRYYVFTSGTANVAANGSNSDLYTINFNNNGGTNYNYTVQNAYSSAQTGNWSTGATWLGGAVPLAGANVIIQNTHNVTLNINATISGLTINSGANFTASDATPRALSILSNTTATTLINNGTWANGTGGSTVDFRSDNAITHTISGTIGFQNVSITRNSGTPNIGLNFGAGSTINGNFQINVGGFVVASAAPNYTVGSTLVYATGTTYGRSDEWITNTPHNVRITNGTTLDIRNGSVVARTMNGNLIIEAGSSASMGNMTGALTVGGGVEINGTLTLSSAEGGDLRVAGNFTNNGTFASNGRVVTYNGTGSQTITGNTTFVTLVNSNVAGQVQVSTGTIITVTGTGIFNAANSNFVVNGVFRNLGNGITGATLNVTSTNFTISGTGTYEHAATYSGISNLGTIPTATWSMGSTCLISGLTNPASGSWFSPATSAEQSFSNFIWNCSGQINPVNMSGNTMSISGTFSMVSTGTSDFRLGSGTNGVITCVGFNQSGGTIDFAAGTGAGMLNVSGTFNRTAGILIESSSGSGLIVFNGIVNQSINIGININNSISFRLNNPAGITITGSLPINDGATFFRTQGGATGTIAYNATNSSLAFNGVSMTTTDSEWPSANGPSSVTLNTLAATNTITLHASRSLPNAASSVLTLTNGRLQLGNNNLTLNRAATAALVAGSANSFIRQNGTGRLTRAVPTGASIQLFPVGEIENYTPASFNFSANAVAGTLAVSVVDANAPNLNTPSSPTDYISRHWITSATGLTNYTYGISLNYIPADVNGTEANLKVASFTAADWNGFVTSVGAPTISASGLTETNAPLATGELTGRNSSIEYVWNGSASSLWTNAANWTPSNVPTAIDDITISSPGANTLNINDSRSITRLTLSGTGTFILGAAADLTISGIFTSTSIAIQPLQANCVSIVRFNSAANQTVPALTYGNLMLIGGPRTLAGTGTISICGTYTPSASATTISGSTVNFNGSGVQVVPGTHNYNALVIANSNISQVTMGANFTVANGFTVNNGSYFEIQTGRILTLSGGNSQVNGRLRNSNALTQSGGTLAFGPNSLYEHNISGGNLPAATWDNTAPGATCAVIGWLGSTGAPGNLTPVGGFSNFIWNSPSQSGSPNFEGALQLINRIFTITNTGISNRIFLSNATNGSLQAGVITVNGGILATNNNLGIQTISSGSISVTSGTFQLEGNGIGLTSISGLFSHTGGTIIRNSGTQIIEFNGNILQTVGSTVPINISSQVNFRVNNPNGITISGTLPVNNNATFICSQGTVTGTVTYGTGTTLLYNNTSLHNQSGEWPASFGPVNITMNGTGGITLLGDRSIPGTLDLTNGNIILGTNSLTISSTSGTAINNGSNLSYVVTNNSGQLFRALPAAGFPITFNFPVGLPSSFSPASFIFSSNSENNRLLGLRVADGVHPQMAPNPAIFLQNRYWITTLSNILGTYTYTPTFTFVNPADVSGSPATDLRLNQWTGVIWNPVQTATTSPPNMAGIQLTQNTGSLANTSWSGRAVRAPNTYTWIGADNQPWTVPANWSPALVPSSGDAVIFNHNNSRRVVNVPTGITLTSLNFINAGTTSLFAGSAGTLSVGGGTSPQISVAPLTTMLLDGTQNLSLALLNGNSAVIEGNVGLQAPSGSFNHSIIPSGFESVEFRNGSYCAVGRTGSTNYSGHPFGASGSNDAVVFRGNSTLEQFDGASPFGSSSSDRLVKFETGSTYKYSYVSAAATPGLSNRSFANFEYNAAGTRSNSTTVYGNPFIMDALTIRQGNWTIESSAITNQINGSITIDGGASLTLNNLSTGGTFILSGGNTQNISGLGDFNIGTTATIIVANSSGGVSLQKNMTVNGIINIAANAIFNATGTNIVSGTGTFNLLSDGLLGVGSPDGLFGSASSGNVQTNIRTISSNASVRFNGVVPQITGNIITSTDLNTLKAIYINNPLGVTLSGNNNNINLTTLGLEAGTFAIGTGQQVNMVSGGGVVATGGNFATGINGGVLNFAGAGSFTGDCNPYNVHISGGVNFGTGNVTIQDGGRLRINANGGVVNNGPFYAVGSTLQYNVGAQSPPEPGYSRWREWNAASGRGFPHHVMLSNSTQLNPARVDNAYAATPFHIGGNLIIEENSAIDMDRNNSNMAVPLIIAGNLDIAGRLSGSQLPGGDVSIAGNWVRHPTGAYIPNNRAVIFTGDGNTQTITRNPGGTETFAYFIVNKPNGAVQLTGAPNATNVVVNGAVGGNNLQLLNGNLDLNGRTFEWAGTGNLQTEGNREIFSINPGTFLVSGGARAIAPGLNSTLGFNNQTTVIISAGLDFAPSATTINGTLQINGGGFVNSNAPFYGASGTLIYNSNYERRVEWSGAAGQPGYPNNVIIRTGTTLFASGTQRFPLTTPPSGEFDERVFEARGNVTIETGATLNMLGNYPMKRSLVVAQDLTINGTLIGSNIIGADIVVGRNWYRSGTFNHNNRAVIFYTEQHGIIANNGGTESFPYVIVDKTGGTGTTLTLASPVNIEEKFTLTSGRVVTDEDNILSITNDAPDGPDVGVAVANLDLGVGYVDGPMSRTVINTTGTASYLFPVGSFSGGAHYYKRFRMDTVANASTSVFFIGEYKRSRPPGIAPWFFQDNLMGIRANEYWDVNTTSAAAARLILPYETGSSWLFKDQTSILIEANSNVSIVRGEPAPLEFSDEYNWNYTGKSLIDDPFFSNFGDAPQARAHTISGDISSRLITEFSPFTFGFGMNTILPLRLLSFAATLHGNDAQLHWQLADANDLRHFEVEYSTNGQQFNRLATINDNGGTLYNYRYAGLNAGVHYYRLKMVEKDGRITYSKVEVLMLNANRTLITGLLQNPVVGGQAFVGIYSEKPQYAEAVLYDMAGRALLRQKVGLQTGYNKADISVMLVPKGMYLMHIRSEDGVEKTIRLIK